MQERNKKNNQERGKGHSVFIAGTYVGSLVIKEFDQFGNRQISEDTVAKLQDPDKLEQLIVNGHGEFKPFKDKEVATIENIDDLLAPPVVDADAATG